MEPISLVIAAGLFVAGLLGGRIARRRSSSAHGAPAAICDGCQHNLSYHDVAGTCSHQVRRRNYNSSGLRMGHQWVTCQCRQYVGPIPAERMLASFPLPAPDRNGGADTDPRSGR